MQTKLIYHIAMTADHFIAHEDGSIAGLLMEGQHTLDYMQDLQNYDTVLMGKNTYEWAYQFGLEAGQAVPTYGHMMQYVFSTKMPKYKHEQLCVIRDDPAVFVQGLKDGKGGNIYLCGGGRLAAYLLNHQLIDEIILKVNPVLFGSGIPVFSDLSKAVNLSLINTTSYDNGVVTLHYALNA